MGLTGSGGKFIFKLHSLMHNYNSNILTLIQFPHLTQKPELKEYTAATNSTIAKTM